MYSIWGWLRSYMAAQCSRLAALCSQSAAKMQPNGVIPGKLGTLGAILAARVQPGCVVHPKFCLKTAPNEAFGCIPAAHLQPKMKKLKPSKTDVSIAFGTFKNLGVPLFIKFCDEKFFGCFFRLHIGG